MCLPGFLPVIYTWLKSRRHSIHNQADSEPDLHNKFDSPRPLQGWNILLLWIPAACDLTGTTVSLPNLLVPHPFNIISSSWWMLASSIHPFQFIKWHVALWSCSSASSASYFSVAAFGYISIYPTPIYASIVLTSVSRWVSLIIVIAGVALVGYSGSLIKDAVEAITVLLARALGNHNDDSLIHSSAEEPELGKVLVGKFSSRHLMSKSNLKFQTSLLKAFSLFYLHKYCKSTSLLLTHVGYLLFVIPC